MRTYRERYTGRLISNLEKFVPMLRKLLFVLAGCSLTVLGVIGLVVPIMPGLLFLAAAVACFSVVSTAFRDIIGVHLFRQPRYRLARRRWNAGAGLPWAQRIRQVVWSGLAAAAPVRHQD